MSGHRCGRRHVTLWAAILTSAMSSVSSPESWAVEKPAIDAAAQQLVLRLLEPGWSKRRPPVTSDDAHARSIDPVLTSGAAVWVHEAIPAPPLTVMGGRVLTYRDLPYDPLEAPLIKIRPIDDGQRIPFLIRTVWWPERRTSPRASLVLTLPAPVIFDTRVAGVTVWVGPHRAEVETDRPAGAATISIRVPLESADLERPGNSETPITVIVEGELVLGSYRILAPGRFRNVDHEGYGSEIDRLARIEVGLDATDDRELQRIRDIAGDLTPGMTTDYERIVEVNNWVAASLRYRETPSTRTPLEALEDRTGDCDDHAALMVVMLRAMGIASRPVTGLLYDLNTLSAHAWVEVALPKRDRDLHWFIVDPTLAGTTPIEAERSSFVQLRDRILFYPIRPTIGVEGAAGHRSTDVLFNWKNGLETSLTAAAQLDEFIDRVVEGVDQSISRRAEALAAADLLLHRESSTIAGSPYVVVDRPVAEESDTRLRLRLENEERLVLEVAAADGNALESKSDLETIDQLNRAYTDLNELFFAGAAAYRNLEIVYRRDRHTDRLHIVSLRVGRYLVESHLDRILRRLSKRHLLTEAETATLDKIADVSGGKNLYVLQELARHNPR